MNEKTIQIFPNPVTDFLQINSKNKISKIEVFDLMGRLLNSTDLADNKIDLSNLQSGNYLVKIHAENSSFTTKFTKN